MEIILISTLTGFAIGFWYVLKKQKISIPRILTEMFLPRWSSEIQKFFKNFINIDQNDFWRKKHHF